MWWLIPLLLCASDATIVLTGYINVSRPLGTATEPVRVVFLDFDKTLTINSFGSTLVSQCDANCSDYFATSACTCNLTTNQLGDWLVANHANRVLDEGDVGFSGIDRRDRINETLKMIAAAGVEVKIVSTSWVAIPAAAWQYFVYKTMQIAGLSTWFPMENIYALDDPGFNIPADKGSVMQAYLQSKGWDIQNGLFVDDSAGNILSADGKVDWLQVANRTGLTENQLQWIEQRVNTSAALGTFCACPNGVATTMGGTNGDLCEKDNTVDCSSCNSYFYLSAPAALGLQSCMPFVCSCSNGTATTAFGSGGTLCESNNTMDCSSCNAGHVLNNAAGTGAQICVDNVCECPNGVATTAYGSLGTLCESNGTVDCSSCSQGYHLSATAQLGLQTCVANDCYCPNGVATVATGSQGTLCETNGTVDCSQCNSGYTLSANAGLGIQMCSPSVCTCAYGTPSLFNGTTPQKLCETNGTEDCSTCNPGYSLSSLVSGVQTCIAHVCTCTDGTPALASGATAQTLCEVDATEDCSACNSGYHANGTFGTGAQNCVANLCTCTDGNATMADGQGAANLCDTHMAEDCSACNSGYVLLTPAAAGPQSCAKLPKCPGSDLTTWVAICRDSDVATGCSLACATASTWLSDSLTKLNNSEMIADCFRAWAANVSTPYQSKTVDDVISRVQGGKPICSSLVNSASAPFALFALFVSVATCFMS